MKPRNQILGKRQMTKEVEIFGAIFMLLSILIFTIYFGLSGGNLNFDPRDQAAGNTIFLSNGGDLQGAIDKAGPSDAIFLNPGSYSVANANGFTINNKKIRILGAGDDYTNIVAAGTADYVFNIVNSNVTLDSLKISGAKKDGVLLDNGSQSSLALRNATISGNSSSGINSLGKLEVSRTTFDQNGDAIISTSSATIENVTIKNSAKNGINLASTSNSNSKVSNTLINNNAGTAIAISGNTKAEIKNVTAAANGAGIVETVATPLTTIVNTIVQGSKTDGIALKNASSTVSYSNSFQNTTSNYNPTTLGNATGNLSIDSRFTSASDFRLGTSSTIKNLGAPTEADADGSRIDMGAFGGKPLLADSNNLPKVTSTPPEYVKPGQSYNYEIKATDSDGDALSYVILNNNLPSWLKINNNVLSGTPTSANIGYYGIMVIVSDKKGGNVVHPVSINVIPDSVGIPSPTPTNGGTPIPTASQAQPVAPKISIVSPKASSVFSKDNNEIKWSVTGGTQITAVEIKYSTDNQNYTTITTLPGTVNSYKWTDIEKLTSGKYFIRIEVKDSSNPPLVVGTTSEQFSVTNVSTTPATDSITITKNSPEDNDVVSSRRQTIVVEFKPGGSTTEVNLNSEQTSLKVNGERVKFDTTRNTIFYQPDKDYTGNRIQVEVELVTQLGGKASKQWGFNIEGTTTPQNPNPTVSSNETIFGIPRAWGLAILGVLILILLLLILYFVIRFIRSIRDQRQGNLEAEFTEYYDSTVYPQQGATASAGTPAEGQDQSGYAQAHGTDLNQYYANQEQQTAQVDPNQPTITEYSPENQNQLQVSQTPIDQTQQNNEVVADQGQLVQTFDQQNIDPTQQVQVDPNQAYVDPNQNQSQQVVQEAPQTGNDANYIDDLKRKYGVTNEQIDQYNQQQNQNNQNPNQPQA